jgi:hypothetical protein
LGTVAIVKELGEHVAATTSAAAIADRPNGILLMEDHSGLFGFWTDRCELL